MSSELDERAALLSSPVEGGGERPAAGAASRVDSVGGVAGPRQRTGKNAQPEEQRKPAIRRHRPRYRLAQEPPPPRTTLAAALMLVSGSMLLFFGVLLWMDNRGVTEGMSEREEELRDVQRERGQSMVVLGGILFTPGSYASINLLGAYLGWPGWTYDAVPSYDED